MIATLTWNSNTEEDLSHYVLYYGRSSGVYSSTTLDSSNTATVTGLLDGVRYYFVITAVDTSGNESGFSDEVSKINKRVRIRM